MQFGLRIQNYQILMRQCMILNAKASYSGARAIVSTSSGGEMYVYADGSFKYKTYPEVLHDGTAGTDSFYYAVQSEDTTNNRISDIKKVYIGFNIGNTTPTGITFKEADGTTVITDNDDFDIAEDAKSKI